MTDEISRRGIISRRTLFLFILLFSTGLVFGEIGVSEMNMWPSVLLVSTKNVTFTWDTELPATSFINCTGPGMEVLTTPVEMDPVTRHAFNFNTSFSGEGFLYCTLLTFPVNETLVVKNFNVSVNCEGTRLELPNPSIGTVVYFNRPKGSGPYLLNLTVRLRNACVGRSTVSASAGFLSGISARVEPFAIHALESIDVLVPMTVQDSTAEGAYSGGIAFSAEGKSITAKVNVSVRWPGPRLEIEKKALGNLKSGTNLTTYLNIKETLGYRKADGVFCSVSFDDGRQAAKTYPLGSINPFGSTRCPVSLVLPGNDVLIGNYSVYVKVNSSNAGQQTLATNYTIPAPYLLLAPKSLNLGKLTFESGKDLASTTLTVIENGGFTPIEELSFELIEGEKGWVVLPKCGPVPPGEKVECTFKVMLGENASIGTRGWKIKVKSRYTPEIVFDARTEVYFIGVEDAILSLEAASNYSVMTRFGQAETLKTSAVVLLRGAAEGDMGMADTATVMSITGGVASLMGQMEKAYVEDETGDTLSSARSLLGARMALERISSSYRTAKVNRSALLGEMGTVYSASADFWTSASDGLLRDLEAKAAENEKTNYLMAAEYYYLLGMIYKQSDSVKSDGFSQKSGEMEKLYKDSVERAGAIKNNADKLLAEAREGTTFVGSFRLVLNPLAYRASVGNYKLALEDYEASVQLYKIAGQQNELSMLRPKLEAVQREYELIERAFVAGSVALAILSVIVIMRVTVGMQQYREDEDDIEMGGVMVR